MQLTYTQCKQLARNYPNVLRDVVEQLHDQPDWIAEPLDMADIQAIQQGGCASGAYMPAVTYYKAAQTMAAFGNEVLEYIESNYGEIPAPPKFSSWGGMACHYLSMAVELWAGQFDLDGVDWD